MSKNSQKNAIANQSKSILSENRYRLTLDEEALLFKYRESRSLLEKDCAQAGINVEDVKHFWYKSKLFSIFAKPQEKSIDDIKSIIIKDLQKYSPKFKTIVRKPIKDPHCLVIDICDIHIGKLASAYETGEEYNVDIAIKRVHEGVEGLLQRVSGFNINKIVCIIGNDVLHTEGNSQSTTSGTRQSVDGNWDTNFLKAKDLIVSIIEKLMLICDIRVVHNMSNHDFCSGFFLAQTIEAYFRRSKNITFDTTTRYRKAFIYGKNLIGTTHGDAGKENQLPVLLAQEFPQEWAQTEHRYIYTHHVHHKSSKDYIGATVESSRSISSTDSWHHKSQYQHAPKALEAYLHSFELGQVARFTYIFK